MQGSTRERERPAALAEDDPQWCTVRTWPALSAEAKLSWRRLYLDAGGVERLVSTKPSDLGGYQGKSETSGRRDIKALVLCGLIRVVDRREGRWECLLENPLDVQRARLASESAAQGELFDRHDVDEPDADEATSSPADSADFDERDVVNVRDYRHASAGGSVGGCVADNASAAARLNLCNKAHALSPLPLSKRSAPSVESAGDQQEVVQREDNGTVGGSVAGGEVRQDDRELARRLEAITGPLPDVAEQEQWIADTTAYIVRRVDDPKLEEGIPRSIAIAICYGQFELPELYKVLGYFDRTVRSGKLRAEAPWCLFYGCMRKRFKKLGLRL